MILRAAVVLLFAFFTSTVVADPIAQHNKESREMAAKITAYEKRIDDLVAKKKDEKDGPELEEILNDISDIQKELVGIKKKRRQLREHITKYHPGDEVLGDLDVLKDMENVKHRSKSADPAIDTRLDAMMTKLQAQYKRTIKDKEDYTVEQKAIEEELNKKATNVQKATKDEYIKENIKTKLKITPPKSEGHPKEEAHH